LLSHDDFEKALGSMLAAGELEEAHHAELHDEMSSGDDFSDDDSDGEGGLGLITYDDDDDEEEDDEDEDEQLEAELLRDLTREKLQAESGRERVLQCQC
jgi:hypothetical protein